MLKVDGVSKSFDGAPLFRQATFTVNPGDRIGIVGPNGVGKTTLLRIIVGDERPDGGRVLRSPDERIGYLPQQTALPELAVHEYLLEVAGSVGDLSRRLSRLEEEMRKDGDGLAKILAEYGDLQDRYRASGGWAFESKMQSVLQATSIDHKMEVTRLGDLSGGEQARVMLAGVLLRDPTSLVLDEPTNHLDIDGLEWLEGFLASFAGPLLLVSHDRRLLDKLMTKIIELDGIDDTPTIYPGNYTSYVAERSRKWERMLLDWEAQEKYRRRIANDIAQTKDHARRTESSTKNDHYRRLAKKVAKKAKARERRLKRQLESAQWLSKPETRPAMNFGLAGSSDKGRVRARLSRVSIAFGSQPILENASVTVRGRDRVALFAENGTGKSSILKALTGELPVTGEAKIEGEYGYLPQDHLELPLKKTVIEYFRSSVAMFEDEARSILNQFLFENDQLGRRLSALSPGERARLVLATMVARGVELLLLDEPTNHLDFDSFDRVEGALVEYKGTLIVVSHDRYLLSRLRCSRFLTIKDRRLVELPASEVSWLTPETLQRRAL